MNKKYPVKEVQLLTIPRIARVKSVLIDRDFSDMASDWLAAVLPADRKPSFKILVNYLRFDHGHFYINADTTSVGYWWTLQYKILIQNSS